MDLYPQPAALRFVIRRIVSGVIEHTVLSLHCRRVRMCLVHGRFSRNDPRESGSEYS